jgi:hypothetical protein
MSMWSVAGLELTDPQIRQKREGTPSSSKEPVQVPLELPAVNGPIVVIGAAELRA